MMFDSLWMVLGLDDDTKKPGIVAGLAGADGYFESALLLRAVTLIGLLLHDRELVECSLPALSVTKDTGEQFIDELCHRLLPTLRFMIKRTHNLSVDGRRVMGRAGHGVLLVEWNPDEMNSMPMSGVHDGSNDTQHLRWS